MQLVLLLSVGFIFADGLQLLNLPDFGQLLLCFSQLSSLFLPFLLSGITHEKLFSRSHVLLLLASLGGEGTMFDVTLRRTEGTLACAIRVELLQVVQSHLSLRGETLLHIFQDSA